ncbi:uncharacterized protein LOC141850974 [Brevipalpus obovatus]|uniref:uncharacterized protein LOC141850974 n=1 Tax=Brevipalpus obovatus TaxID=246614 RepID=UPI003D9F73D6
MMSFLNKIFFITLLATFALLSLVLGQDATSEPIFSAPREMNLIEEYIDWELWLSVDTLIQAVRLRHGVAALNFNDTLSKLARHKALVRAWYINDIPVKDPLINEGIGENFYFDKDPAVILNGSEIMHTWYTNGEKNFDYDTQTVNETNRAFVNMVEPAVEQYGCGQVRSHRPNDILPGNGKDGVGVYIVCLFQPVTPPGVARDFAVTKPQFEFEDDEFNFSMTDDLRNSLVSRLEGNVVRQDKMIH